MTPGLAFFYGGMVRAKSVLNMLMMSFVTIGIVSVLWVLYGFSVSFGTTGNGFWGGLKFFGMGEAGASQQGRWSLVGSTASQPASSRASPPARRPA